MIETSVLLYFVGFLAALSRADDEPNGCMDLFDNAKCKCGPKRDCRENSDKCAPPTDIECVDANYESDEILLSVGSGHFSSLRSVTFRGNVFTHLPSKMFGQNEYYLVNVEKMDFSSNSIVNISNDAFCGLINLKRLDLSDNKVFLDIGGDHSLFQNLPNLIELRLQRFFAQPVNVTQQLNMLKVYFKKAKFKNFHSLDLSNNELDFVPKTFLCPVGDLRILNLADNLLTTLDLEPKCLKNLKAVDLSRNRLVTLDPDFLRTVGGMNSEYMLKLFANPFECNCNSQVYLNWIETTKLIVHKENLTCDKASPKRFAGKHIYPFVVHTFKELDCGTPVVAEQPVDAAGSTRPCYFAFMLTVLCFVV